MMCFLSSHMRVQTSYHNVYRVDSKKHRTITDFSRAFLRFSGHRFRSRKRTSWRWQICSATRIELWCGCVDSACCDRNIGRKNNTLADMTTHLLRYHTNIHIYNLTFMLCESYAKAHMCGGQRRGGLIGVPACVRGLPSAREGWYWLILMLRLCN